MMGKYLTCVPAPKPLAPVSLPDNTRHRDLPQNTCPVRLTAPAIRTKEAEKRSSRAELQGDTTTKRHVVSRMGSSQEEDGRYKVLNSEYETGCS